MIGEGMGMKRGLVILLAALMLVALLGGTNATLALNSERLLELTQETAVLAALKLWPYDKIYSCVFSEMVLFLSKTDSETYAFLLTDEYRNCEKAVAVVFISRGDDWDYEMVDATILRVQKENSYAIGIVSIPTEMIDNAELLATYVVVIVGAVE